MLQILGALVGNMSKARQEWNYTNISFIQDKSRTIQILVLFKPRLELYKYWFCSIQDEEMKNKLAMSIRIR